MSDNLYMNGHTYAYKKDMPCPYPGSEAGIVSCSFKGRPAWWKAGKLYVLKGSTELHPALDWVSRINGPTKGQVTRKNPK